MNRKITSNFKLKPIALSMLYAFQALTVYANPEGGQVVAGSAAITSTSSNRMDINQTSQRAIVNWNSFSINQHEHVNFNQPSVNSAILNRVTGNQVSTILGKLTSNGQVFLVNPNGIIFGKTAQVNVGSLIASTANISNDNFMKNNLVFDQMGKPGAKIINEGSITVAEQGIAGFVAPEVRNSGYITAKLGKVTLASGEAFSVDLYGDQLINLIITPDQAKQYQDAYGNLLSRVVDQSGQINAEGGYVVLTTGTAKQLVDGVVNMSGLTKVSSVSQTGGKITLHAGENGTVNVSGKLEANSTLDNGGNINITAKTVNVLNGANIETTGKLGGKVNIGGNYQGRGPLLNAQNTNIANNTNINAGEFGNVVVWSDGNTQFFGNIFANKGEVEVSGKQHLKYAGNVVASKLLLDPRFIVIDDSANPNDNVSSTLDDIIGNQVINALLAQGTSVSLLADQGIYVNAKVDGRTNATGNGGDFSLTATNGEIVLNNNIITNNGKVTLSAGTEIFAATNTFIDTGTAEISMVADGDMSLQGLIGGDLSLTSTNGSITLNQAIGGNNALNPSIAKVDINAKNNVVLNGINAAGVQSAIHAGLKVVAGGNITSNQKIAVNNGALIFGDNTTDKFILKDSIYSRNGYGIDVFAPLVLGLGDKLLNCFATECFKQNNADPSLYASIPQIDSDAGPFKVLHNGSYFVPKIVISNNEDYLSPSLDGSKGSQKIRILNTIENQNSSEKVLLKVVGFVDGADRTSIQASILTEIQDNNYQAELVTPVSFYLNIANLNNYIEKSNSVTTSTDFEFVISEVDVDGNTNTGIARFTLVNTDGFKFITNLSSDIEIDAFEMINANDYRVTLHSGSTSIISFPSIIRSGISSTETLKGHIGQIYGKDKVNYYFRPQHFFPGDQNDIRPDLLIKGEPRMSIELNGFNELPPRFRALENSDIHYVHAFYDGALATVGREDPRADQFGPSTTTSNISDTANNTTTSFVPLGNSISNTRANPTLITSNMSSSTSTGSSGATVGSSGTSSAASGAATGDGGRVSAGNSSDQFLNQNNKVAEVSAELKENQVDGTKEEKQMVFGGNPAKVADLGRGGSNGAASDVFESEFCIVSGSNNENGSCN